MLKESQIGFWELVKLEKKLPRLETKALEKLLC